MAFEVDPIKNLYGKASRFVDWFVEEVFHNRNWSALLLLLDVIVFVAFNPWQWPFKNLIDLFPRLKFTWYESIFSLVVLVILAAAIVVRARRRKSSVVKRSELKLSAIKGLLPFGHNADDVEIFTSLQRERNLDECLQAISDPQWRFGVLSGESGAGKTSFLQAALWPALEAKDHRCVYVKFSDLDPFQSVEQAFAKQLSLLNEPAGGDGFVGLFSSAALQSKKPLILILDQFEQFFVHLKRKKDRKPFVQALGEWYTHQQSLPIKILISVRGDFFYRLNELQQTLKYSLSPTQSFRLDRFEPAQAAEIFCVIAEKERLEYNRGFITQMTKQELADSDDELVSPVDIQVLAWMVAGQSDVANRAFNRTAFQKLGGVEGLLERFLARALDSRETEGRRQTAIKVLLGLTDLERNTRAGALTIDALRDKLESDLSDADLNEAVMWLSRGDVRLVAPSSEDGEEKYELAHERIIPALRRLAGKTLEPVSRANQLLDSRVNEWVGNGRSSRYLFSFSELRLIRKQRPFITWDKTKSAKDGLIAASSRRLKIRMMLSFLLVLLPTASWFVWNTNRVQLYLIRRDLEDIGLRSSDGDVLGQIATAFAISGDNHLVHLIPARISSEFQKSSAYRLIADAEARLGNKAQALQLLEVAVQHAKRITLNSDKAIAQKSIAESYSRIGDKDRAQVLLKDAMGSANAITDQSSQAGVRISIANGFARLGDDYQARHLVDNAMDSIAAITGDSPRAAALSSIANAIARGYDRNLARLVLRGLGQTHLGITDRSLNAATLRSIAVSAAHIGDRTLADNLLDAAIESAERISDSHSKVDALRSIGLTYLTIGDRAHGFELLSKVGIERERSSDRDKYESSLEISLFVASSIELDSREIERIVADYDNSSFRTTLFELFAIKGGPVDSSSLLILFEGAPDESRRYEIFKALTRSKSAPDIGNMRSLASRFGENYKARALALILILYSHPELAREEDERSRDKGNDEAK